MFLNDIKLPPYTSKRGTACEVTQAKAFIKQEEDKKKSKLPLIIAGVVAATMLSS